VFHVKERILSSKIAVINFTLLSNISVNLCKMLCYFFVSLYVVFVIALCTVIYPTVQFFILDLSCTTTKTKLRKVERKLVPVLEKLSIEELMETNTYQRFNRSIEMVLENTEDLDVTVELGMSCFIVRWRSSMVLVKC
jgi:hypothetical protein